MLWTQHFEALRLWLHLLRPMKQYNKDSGMPVCMDPHSVSCEASFFFRRQSSFIPGHEEMLPRQEILHEKTRDLQFRHAVLHIGCPLPSTWRRTLATMTGKKALVL